MKNPKLIADAVALLLAGGFGGLAWQFAQVPTTLNLILAAILIAGALRALLEITINRDFVPTVATGRVTRRKIAALLQAELAGKAAPVIYDLGSGRGELTRAIARCLPQARVIGIERGRVPYLWSCAMARLTGRRNLAYRQADIFATGCRDADAVVIFLGKLTGAVAEKLRRELTPGAIIVSSEFAIAGWQPSHTLSFRTPFRTTVFLYRQG